MVIRTVNQNENNTTATTPTEDGRVIRNARIARQLLKVGQERVRIIDIKAARENPERSVFVFKNDAEFQKVLDEVLEGNRKSRDTAREDEMKNEIEKLKQQIDELKKMHTEKNEVKE